MTVTAKTGKSRLKRDKGSKRIGARELAMTLDYLQEWLHGVHRGRLTWHAIERYTGFSRQALAARSEIVDVYERIKAMQRPDLPPKKKPLS